MLLLIDNYDSFTYNLYQMIAQLGIAVKVVRNDQITIAEIKQLSPAGIVMSPGPGRPEDAGICTDIVNAFSGTIPILGICLGHQVIAHAFSATVTRSNQVVHGKTALIFHNRGLLYQKTNLPFEAGRYHSLIVEEKNFPSALIIEARTSDDLIMGIRHTDHLTFGVQFHPESILSDSSNVNIMINFTNLCHTEATSC